MRKKIATVAGVIAALGAFGTAAGPAAADDHNATVTSIGTPGQTYGLKCETPWRGGVFGQYGAWGSYVDGCTVKVYCHPPRGSVYWGGSCTARTTTTISTYYRTGDRVTMNARLREHTGNDSRVTGWTDRSCNDYNTCTTTDVREIPIVNAASIQCNGVREYKSWATNYAKVSCAVELTYAR